MNELCFDELERLKEDIKNKDFGTYVDTWDFEDEYSHNEIEEARQQFIEHANEYFDNENLPYKAKEHCKNVRIFDKNTGEKLYS